MRLEYDWAASSLLTGTAVADGTVVPISMLEPWTFELGTPPHLTALPCQPESSLEWAESLFALTQAVLGQLGEGYRRADLVDDPRVAADALARPVRALVGAVAARSESRRILEHAHGVKLEQPETVPVPSPPPTTGALEDLLGCSSGLSQSLFFLGHTSAAEDTTSNWMPFGRRLIRGGRRPRGRYDNLWRDLATDASMMAAARRVAVPAGLLDQPSPVTTALRSFGKIIRVSGAREPFDLPPADDSLRVAITSATPTSVAEPLRRLLPISLVEGFPRAHRRAKRYIRFGPPTVIAGVSRNDWNAVWMATARADGAEIWGNQHGGAYGEMVDHVSGDAERMRSDVFVTAGWGAHVALPPDTCRTISLASPRLSRLCRTTSKRVRRQGGVLLFQVSAFDRATMTLGHPGLRRLAERHERLLTMLDPDVRSSLSIRVRPERFVGEHAFYQQLLGEMGRSLPRSTAPIAQMLATTTMVVIPRLFSTTFLECLATDTPVMIVDDTAPAGLHPDFEDTYEELEDAGVLVTDVARAAAQLNAIYPDEVDAWWNGCSAPVHRARDLLAMAEPDYGETWIERLAQRYRELRRGDAQRPPNTWV